MGWKPLAFSEIEKFPSEVLKHHYPDVPNLGDMTKFKEWELGADRLDLLVGGTPCQAFSVAGLRKGLDDPRGNLALTYVAILNKFRPKWCVWENVPGVLSSNGGKDFGSFLTALGELGYGWAYRVLDAQYFGVAQRRKRVFVVGCFGNWESASKVLFESESLSRNTKQSRKERKETSENALPSVVGTLLARDYKGLNSDDLTDGKAILTTNLQNKTFVESSFGTFREDKVGGTTKASGGVLGGGSETLVATENNVPLPHAFKVRGGCAGGGKGYLGQDEKAFTLSTMQDQQIFQQMAVRRLTEIECERLQGFPDNYTNIKENCPSGARYKALGNSMAVPVMKWIGNRIQMVEDGLI
jgi:DNA (cytosine-5)-methyltransferase 1